MQKIELTTTDSEQSQKVELDGLETGIRVYWSEIPKHQTGDLGNNGSLLMDVKNDILDIKGIVLTVGNELTLPYGIVFFGGFIAVTNGNNINIEGSEWTLYYIPIVEIEEIRKLYGAII